MRGAGGRAVAGCGPDGRREAPIEARALCIGILIGLLAGRAWAGPPRVTQARLAGTPLVGATPTLDRLLGESATPDVIAEALRALEGLPDAGNFDVAIDADGERAALTVVHYPRVRYVGTVAVQVDGEDLGLPRSRALLRRVDVRDAIFLGGGRRFHPYLLTVDRAALTRWHRRRGYRDVALRAVFVERNDLVDVGWQIARGDRYVYAAPRLAGMPRGVSLAGLRVAAGAVVSPGDLDADRARLEARLCAQGFARARVTASEAIGAPADGQRPVTVTFAVDAGPRITTGAVQVAGRYVPQVVLATLQLKEGDPYCPTVENAARRRLVEFLRDAGVPDPRIEAHRRTWLRPDGRRVLAVTFDVRRLVAARVERIWYVGNRVTSMQVMRQLTAITEGAPYRQSLVDESVQAMRRSGLFRKVGVDIIESARADRVSLRFRLVERPPFRVDPVGRAVTLYNLDVISWPDDLTDVRQGFAFRGEGQQLDLYGKPESFGFRWFHGFLGRYLVSSATLRVSKSTSAAFEDRWVSTGMGIGVKTATNDANAQLVGEVVFNRSKRLDAYPLDVLDGDAFAGVVGLQIGFDLTRRNDERIQFLGLQGSTTVRVGRALTGEPIQWMDDVSRLKLHLPLHRTTRGQHWVLRLGVRNRAVVSLGDAALPGHLRRRPAARGFKSTALGVAVLGDDGEARFGGLHAVDSTLELRIPVPIGRRNAITPFLDAAMAADRVPALLDEVRYAAGLAISISLFQERIEGVIWGAWPIGAQEGEGEYVGGGFGGGF